MNIVIRTDSSVSIGTGHVMRCLTLADELGHLGGKINFICREEKGNLITLIEEKGYRVYRLNDRQFNPANAAIEKEIQQAKSVLTEDIRNIDLLIVDHYDLDAQWETQMRPVVKKIMVIDDLANRSHNCDILLDQNFYENIQSRYSGITPEHCQKLLGPQYALLRQEFIDARKKLRKRNGDIRRLLVFFGSSDPTNETAKALRALRLLNSSHLITIDVVVGSNNPQKEMIRELCRNMQGTHYHCQVDNMAQLMVRADLAIGAGGSTYWQFRVFVRSDAPARQALRS